jgi:hypothetical protein
MAERSTAAQHFARTTNVPAVLRPLTVCLLIGFASMAPTMEVRAQDRTYDAAALRLDSGFDGLKVVRGVSDSVVLSIGILRAADVVQLVGPSPNAITQAKVFEANYRKGVWTAVLGMAIWPTVYAINHIGPNQPVPLGVTFISAALVVYGAQRIDSAKRALSRAIWWYNRDLVK